MNEKFHINMTKTYPLAYHAEKGVVLFIALIALVVMSLAAVALIRSVDTNTLIAGNLGFKQSATVSADSGVETAITWLNALRYGMAYVDQGADYYEEQFRKKVNHNHLKLNLLLVLNLI